MMARKNGGDTAGRTPAGTFTRGNPGRPKGARNRATVAAEALLDHEAEALTRRAIELALEGDSVALRLCLDRILPPKRPGDRPVEVIDLPANPGEAMSALVVAAASGRLLLADAERLAGLVKAQAELSALADLETRLARLEENS